MTTVLYDGTYQGWLTAVFEIYEYKFKDISFARTDTLNPFLFGNVHTVLSSDYKATRVLKGLEKHLSNEGLKKLFQTFLSEVSGFDDIMWRFVQHVFLSKTNIESDFANPAVWDIQKAAKLVRRESHRMKAFVRFQLTCDGLFYALVEPDCNVLPLISKHFKGRYTDQRWLIYDGKRKYGIYYDLEAVTTVQIDFNTISSKKDIYDVREDAFQQLWKRYFSSVNIESRKNMKLHMRHIPKRYWKHLTEKMLEI